MGYLLASEDTVEGESFKQVRFPRCRGKVNARALSTAKPNCQERILSTMADRYFLVGEGILSSIQ